MKAKVKETGKIIEATLNRNSYPVSGSGATSVYEGSDGNTYFDTELDFVNIYPDWEQIRIQAAIAAMQGVLSNPAFCNISTNKELPIKIAIYSADALIKELKKEDNK